MKMMGRTLSVALSLAALASPLSAQYFSIGLRGTGSVPTGAFAETGGTSTSNDALIQGAKNGFGYGLDLGLGLGPIGAYAGFDHIKFDCETSTCQSDGKYTMQGVTVGVKLALPLASRFRPYVKGGATFNDLEGSYGSTTQTNGLRTERSPGYEIAVGGDYTLMGIVSITPQARYVGQNLKAKIPGVTTPTTATETGVNYFAFDLGLSVHTPFGGKKH
jgi:opacity protein-like surface antigen